MSPSVKTFAVVLRGPSAVVFWQNETLSVLKFPSAAGELKLTYGSRWITENENVTVPGQLWIEIQGNGNNLEEVLLVYATAGLSMLPILSVATNAAVGDSEIELGFETTQGLNERDYFQSYVAPESHVARLARHLNVSATLELITAISENPESERLFRAADQYRLALDSWKLGGETISLAHLWMAVEALTTVALKRESQKRSCLSSAELAEQLGVDLKKLDATVRKKLLLQGDDECYRKAKDASDGLEHGYLSFDKIRGHASEIRHRMATYVRNAILDLSCVKKSTFDTLMAEPFNDPIGHWPIAKYLRGQLIGTSNELAAAGNAYPFIRWKPTIKSCKPEASGKLNFELTDSLTPELASGVSFRLKSLEAWKPD
ncbi:MAG: hypothetical protein JWR21_4369 [Herminiimonas sp.]|nr:hypothetical protein [Herminiimonas sp.]